MLDTLYTMLFFVSVKSLFLNANERGNNIQIQKYLFSFDSRGDITIEYALCMVIAATLMIGMLSLFQDMSVQIIDEFKQYVSSFPDT